MSTADLVLVEQFLNTLDERTFHSFGADHVPSDALDTVEGLSEWLEAHGLTTPGYGLKSADLESARGLRAALRASLLHPPGSGDGGEAVPALSAFPLVLKADSSGTLRLAADTGVAGLDTLVETVAAAVPGTGWTRLKLCAAHDCRWAFYDTSRSGGGRWCSMQACGNRHKTRAYRQRRAD